MKKQNGVNPILRRHFWDKEKVVFEDRRPLKRGSIHMNFSMKGQEKGDCLIEVNALAGLTKIKCSEILLMIL